MILHSLQIENWRALRNPVVLDDLSPGLNLVHGPNETGKSTVLDAICRGFFDRHKTAGDDMLQRQPWGTKLGPRIRLTFAVGDRQYRLTKQFLSEPMAELEELLVGRWERLAQASAADEQAVALVSGRQSGSGLTKPEHWGLGQVLWAQQGHSVVLDVGESQQSRLRDALRITLSTADVEALETEIRKRYEEVFTPGGKLRTGRGRAEVLTLEEELTAARAALSELTQERAKADQLSFDLESAEAQQRRLQAELAQTRDALTAQRARRDALQEAARQHAQLEAAFRDADRAWQALNDTVQQLRDGEAQLAAAGARVRELEAAVAESDLALTQAQAAATRAAGDREHLIDAARRLDEAAEALDRRLSLLDLQEEITRRRARLDQVRDLAEQVQQVTRHLRALRAPAPAEMPKLRRLHQDLQKARAELAALGLAAELQPEHPLRAEAEADGVPQPAQDVTQPTTWRAARELHLHLPGVGRLTIRSGAREVQKLHEQLAGLEQQWADTLVRLGAATLDELEDRAARRGVLEKEEAMLRGRLTELAAGDLDLAEEQAALEELERQAETQDHSESGSVIPDCRAAAKHNVETPAPAADPASPNHPLDRPALQREKRALDAQRQKLRQQTTVADAALRQTASAVQQSQVAAGQSRQHLAAAKATADALARQLATLRAKDGLDDPTRLAHLSAARQARDLAEQRLAAHPRPATADLDQDLTRLSAREAELNDRLLAETRRIGGLEDALARLGARGLYSRLVELQEQVVNLEARLSRARLNAGAIKLLWDTLQTRKRDVFDALLRPVQALVTTSLQQLVGPSYDAVRFDENLHPAHIRSARAAVDAATDLLSFGTREQLVLLVRLALARLLGREGQRQCVILDDALVNADEARHQRALTILEEAAREAQVLIFTCHPTAYAGLRDARRFDLAALK